MVVDPTKPTRRELAVMAGGDTRLMQAMERLFDVVATNNATLESTVALPTGGNQYPVTGMSAPAPLASYIGGMDCPEYADYPVDASQIIFGEY